MTIRNEIIKGRSVRVQIFAEVGATVRISKNNSGQRFAHIETNTGGLMVPLEMLSLAAGKDAWMRQIEFKCAGCGDHHAASEMECECCQACYEKQGEENAILDGKAA